MGSGPCLPERGFFGHRAEVQPGVGQRGAQRLVGGTGKLAPSSLAALASIGVERRLAFDADVPRGEADHLRSPSAGEDEGQQQGSISPAGDGIRNDGQESPHFFGTVSTGNRLGSPWTLDGVARVSDDQAHPG